jgi:DNA polymerase-3 subunit delta
MMSNYQVVILKEAQQMRNIEDLEKYIKNPVKTTVFVINYKYKKLDKRTKFWKEAVSKQCFFESEKIYDNQLPAFIRQIVKEHEHQIEDKAVETLAEYLGNDLSKIENEVSKLMLNVPKNEIINNAHIEKYIGISREYNIFELQKALAHKNKKKAYQIAEYYVKNSKEYPPFVITGMLNSFFTKALQYQSYQNQQEAKKAMFLNYFQEQDLKEYSKKYSRIQTGKIFDLLLQYDLKMKGVGYAQSEKEPLLKELIYRILNV